MLLLGCAVVLVGPGRYFDQPKSFEWNKHGDAIVDPREVAFAAEFNDVVCRAQVLYACRTGTPHSLTVLLPHTKWKDDGSMRSVASLCQPFADKAAAQTSSAPGYCRVCAQVAPLAAPDRIVNEMIKTRNGWCSHVVLERASPLTKLADSPYVEYRDEVSRQATELYGFAVFNGVCWACYLLVGCLMPAVYAAHYQPPVPDTTLGGALTPTTTPMATTPYVQTKLVAKEKSVSFV